MNTQIIDKTLDFAQIIEEVLRPMSIREIMEKFNPNLPMQLKRVSGSNAGGIITFYRVFEDIPQKCRCGREIDWGEVGPGIAFSDAVGLNPLSNCFRPSCSVSYWEIHSKRWMLA